MANLTPSDNVKEQMKAAGFTIGIPRFFGWYLVAARSNDEDECYFVDQVWFNPDSIDKFYDGARGSKQQPYCLRDRIVAFALIPSFNE